MAKRNRKNRKSDVKLAQANDSTVEVVIDETTPSTTIGGAPNPVEAEVKLPARNASLTAKGAAYAVIAGRPSKQAVTFVFGSKGYGFSWIKRAQILGVKPEDLAADFAKDQMEVKARWEAATAKPKAEATSEATAEQK